METAQSMSMAGPPSLAARVAFAALVSASLYCLWKSTRPRTTKSSHAQQEAKQLTPQSNPINGCCKSRVRNPALQPNNGCCKSSSSSPPGKLFFASQTGASKALAYKLSNLLQENNVKVEVVDPRSYEPEDIVKEALVIIVASTWEDGKPPDNAAFLAQWLDESSKDFRVGAGLLNTCKFAVFGVGSSAYGSTYNQAARAFYHQLKDLGAIEILPLGIGNQDNGKLEKSFEDWSHRLVESLTDKLEKPVSSENGLVDEGFSDYYSDGDSDEDDKENVPEASGLVDLEDVAGTASFAPSKNGSSRKQFGKVNRLVKGFNEDKPPSTDENGPKAMVTPVIRASLEKQGYKIIGSHSGVKLCRWTKSQLRGRGGCYKHSFYGIESHRCMETTPSLACANKCVFCWRHHTNPVGKSWRWKLDDPLKIVEGAIDQHTKMIKQMKGVPGVTQERLTEGLTPRHCALSLVGEPIMYPEINTLVEELHRRRISTFLVTNAQFPDAIRSLRPVTQLYVSIDAATKERLKAIDRPLFSDFWERFIDSLKALRDKQQRTVYRLTLVKGWNTEELDAYTELFKLGKPDFIEIKGVTYCGSSATSTLTMENVPWHSDVRAFSEEIVERSKGDYELACEHAHSCCVLLANANKFKVQDQWFTWIDYERFHDLVASGEAFSSEDYAAPTPSWAVYGAREGGFDPEQARFRKERRHGAP
ncbi:S-adenosyl-L-methionine-dependent tRNA 4-demethylwyosine synthase [Cryptomeria japonica]|uniref:S-adenosyl-L-methionine-dependent tRNA 4-demethylwyosine synthase n=1 Tax=Cryptomeria japonica TaxID=3369 RepID=UPI0027DA05ED|nr:S-adenosyl-L-methionine-dependent tRNA 4-demethylwyosine synthase [Cryptomeria japonica]